MSLLSEAMETFIMMDKSTQPDGYGGYISTYSEGVEFQAALALLSAVEQIAAEQKDTHATYSVITSRAMNLQYHDVIKRKSDGKVFRVTRDGDDNKTPESATLDMRQVEAEEWTLG